MSCSKWAYDPKKCDGDYCCGDCDFCNKADNNEETTIEEGETMMEHIKYDGVFCNKNGCSDCEYAYGDTGCKIHEVRWIPCSEKLPNPNEVVLTYMDTGLTKTYCLAYWNSTLGGWQEWIGYEMLERDKQCTILAWMPLPEPYKELNNSKKYNYTVMRTEALDVAIEALQSEPKHGEWTVIDDTHSQCTECGAIFCITSSDEWEVKFCPNCGAKMDKE